MTQTFESEAGKITVSVIENRDGEECWIHDLEGQGAGVVALMARARRQAQEWGFSEVWANVSNPRLGQILRDHGWVLQQLVFKGKTHGS